MVYNLLRIERVTEGLSENKRGEKMKHIDNYTETLERVMSGKSEIIVATHTRVTRIDGDCIRKWLEKYGKDVIKPEGSGYRLQSGNNSVFCFGQNVFEAVTVQS